MKNKREKNEKKFTAIDLLKHLSIGKVVRTGQIKIGGKTPLKDEKQKRKLDG